jgi:hypothetical protein
MAQIVEKLVAQSFPFVCARNKSCYVEELNGYGPLAVNAGAIVGFTAVGDIVPFAGAFYLEIANCSLGIYGGETEKMSDL